jgi:putative ABC transport system ATP-binding protein
MANALIRTERLCKQYETAAGFVPALKDVNLTIQSGEFLAVTGPSGSGKSTFMNILGCLDTPTSGRYLLDGTDVGTLDKEQLAHMRNKTIGFVFQGYNLLPRANLVDNVALPLVYAAVGKPDRLSRASELLAKVGLDSYRQSFPNEISGGQQQRVAIARALINRPRLILADEPTGNLDTKTSHEIMKLFNRLNDEEDITIVLVTHESDIAAHAKRLVQFVDGAIVYDGAVQDRSSERGQRCSD